MHCVLSNNYSVRYQTTSVKFRALKEQAQAFFGSENVHVARSSSLFDVLAAASEIKHLIQRGQVLYISSGSDLDP